MFSQLVIGVLLSQGVSTLPPSEWTGEILVQYSGRAPVGANISGLGRLQPSRVNAQFAKLSLTGSRINLQRALTLARSQPGVLYAEPNYVFRAVQNANDTYLSRQWALPKIGAPSAWAVNTGMNINIAVLDTGIDSTHPEFAGRIGPGTNTTGVGAATNFSDGHGHGTHCAGVIAAKRNNSVGIAGVACDAKIMPVKVLTDSGSGSTETVAAGIRWAADNNAKVISMSLGGASGSTILESAVNYAWGKGVLIVAAAGNENTTNKSYPGGYTKVVSVGASTTADTRASFSNYGSWVTVAAPGVDIISTYKGGQYAQMSGTSMATPHVAAEAGLLFSQGGASITNAQVRAKIEAGVDPVGNWVKTGRINLGKALAASGGGGGGTGVTTNHWPSLVRVDRGFFVGGNLDSLKNSDNNAYQVRYKKMGTNAYSMQLYMVVPVRTPAGSGRVQIAFDGKASGSSFAVLQVLDPKTNAWVSLKTMVLATNSTKLSFDVPTYSKYLSSGNMQFRMEISGSGEYTFAEDRFQVNSLDAGQ